MSSEKDLQVWVAAQLNIAVEDLSWHPLSGDASFRRYFRCVCGQDSYMVALAPPATEKNHEFVHISALLESAGVLVPHVIAVNYEQGYILQSDFGDVLLRQVLTAESVDAWYAKAMQQLQQMLVLSPVQLAGLPAYDARALHLELSCFRTWLVEAMFGYTCTPEEEQMLQLFFDGLVGSALAQPQVFVHRDYHCRNIMVGPGQQLATIDFQDAVCGPVSYDLVSVLRDCYIVWPDNRVRAWVSQYWQQLHDRQLLQVPEPLFQDWFDLMGLQRHIKVLGVFARLSIRDGKHGYLDDLPTVIRYVQSVAAKHDMAAEFLHWFNARILPLAKQQSWGRHL